MIDSSPTSVDSLLETLSPRRLEILELVAKGLTNEDIARLLGISPNTVRIHLTSIFAHLQVSNRTEAASALFSWKAAPGRVTEILSRPAITVLPLAALDADEGARALAAGITGDLTLLFARWSWFPVIASDSAQTVSEEANAPREAGRRLGARFVVDGSLRTGASSWRLLVRLHDVEGGAVLWAERYDFPGQALFEVQDEICQSIVATSYAVLIKGLQAARRPSGHPRVFTAWELAYEGMGLYSARDRRSNELGVARFSSALELEPDLVLAHFGLGLCRYDEVLNQWSRGGEAAEGLAACAERCLDLAPHSGEGYFLLGRHHQARGRHAEAIEPLMMAISRNPSMAAAHALLAQLLVLTGRPDEGLTRMAHALRLAPRSYVAGLASLHFLRSDHAQALGQAERALSTNPGYVFARVIAAASAWWLGDTEKASEHVRLIRERQPDFSSSRFLATFGGVFEGVARIAQALDALGLGG